MKSNPSFLFISENSLSASRPSRFAALLSRLGNLTVLADEPEDAVKGAMRIVSMPFPARSVGYRLKKGLGLFESIIWNPPARHAVSQIDVSSFDCIVCSGLPTIAMGAVLKEKATRIGKDIKLVVDVREYYTRQLESSFLWRVLAQPFAKYICKKYLPAADLLYTVSPGFITEYRNEFGLEMKLLPSYPYYSQIEPRFSDSERLRLIHQGGPMKNRNLEQLIDVAGKLSHLVALDLMLTRVGSSYYNVLKSRAQQYDNVSLIPPVPASEVPSRVSVYDACVIPYSGTDFNVQHCLPNKLFECIQGGVPILSTPLPDIRSIVEKNSVGRVASGFTAGQLEELLASTSKDNIAIWKQNCQDIARTMSWEENDAILQKDISQLIGL